MILPGDREAILAALVVRTFHEQCMVFIQTKKQAHRMHIILGLLGVNVGELHGNLSQAQVGGDIVPIRGVFP